MSVGQNMNKAELLALFAHASNCMHACLDIPSILRIAVSSAVRLVGARAGSAGLVVDGRLAFSEYSDGQNWLPMSCRFGAEDGWVGDLIKYRKSFIVTEADAITGNGVGFGHNKGFSIFDQVSDPAILSTKAARHRQPVLAIRVFAKGQPAIYDKAGRTRSGTNQSNC